MRTSLIKSLLFILLLSNPLIFTFSQSGNFKISDLKGKTWKMVGLNGISAENRYSTKIISLFYDDQLLGKQKYYLSDSICIIFDNKKVGKIKNGKYIVCIPLFDKKHPNRPSPIHSYEITELTPYKLKFISSNGQLIEFQAENFDLKK